MAYFSYRALDEESRVIRGKIEASDENELESRLNYKGLTLIEATKVTFGFAGTTKLREKDLLNFTYLLNLVLSSGMSIMGGLSDLAKQSSSRKISHTASMLSAKLESGKSISDSMLDYPDLFPSYYTSMVKAGEVSGSLEQIFNDIMVYLEWQIKLKKDVRAALSYPAIVMTAIFLLITILFVFVMPKLLKILTDLKVTLPLPTKILVFIVDVIKGYWPVIILLFILLPVVFRIIYRSETGRYAFDRLTLRIPFFGDLVRKLNHSRYFRTFSTLYRSGLNMNETLKVSADVVKNTYISETMNKVTNAVLGGEQISKALKNTGEFAPLLVNMVEIGEKTGTLDNTVMKISEIYDREIPETLKKIFTIIEPVIIALLGGIVLLALASFFLPLYRIVGGLHR